MATKKKAPKTIAAKKAAIEPVTAKKAAAAKPAPTRKRVALAKPATKKKAATKAPAADKSSALQKIAVLQAQVEDLKKEAVAGLREKLTEARKVVRELENVLKQLKEPANRK